MFAVPSKNPVPPDALGTLRRDTRHPPMYGISVYTDSETRRQYVGMSKTLTDRIAEGPEALEAIVRTWPSPP